jgi:hypothetical protein
MREVVAVDQPCILCEKTLEVWRLFRDDVTGQECIEQETTEHFCLPMERLLRERARGVRGAGGNG